MKPIKIIRISMPVVMIYLFSNTGISCAADFMLKPRIAVSEEYNDNINEAWTGVAKQEEFITRVMPGFFLTYKAPIIDLNSNYNFEYRYYARDTRGDEYTHNLAAATTLTVIDNFFFIDASDTFRRVSLDILRDNTAGNSYRNQSDQNVGTISPYLLWHPGNKTTIKTGYRYTNVWYREPAGVDKFEHQAFMDASYETFSRFYLTCGYNFTRSESSRFQTDRHIGYGGFRYEYADRSFIFGQLGNSWQYRDNGKLASDLFWNAGLTHDMSIAVATLETRVQYTEDPLGLPVRETLYSGKLSRSIDRGNLEAFASYSKIENVDTVTPDREKIALGATVKYEVVDGLTGYLSGTGERITKLISTDYPYRLLGATGLSYQFNNELAIAANYTYITYPYLDSQRDEARRQDINRVVVELSKTF